MSHVEKQGATICYVQRQHGTAYIEWKEAEVTFFSKKTNWAKTCKKKFASEMSKLGLVETEDLKLKEGEYRVINAKLW